MGMIIEFFLGYLAALVFVGIPAELIGAYVSASRKKYPWEIADERMRREREAFVGRKTARRRYR